MKTFELTLKHDNGAVTIRVMAANYRTAIRQVCESEKAPESAITSWRVVPTAKQIRRTQNLLRGL